MRLLGGLTHPESGQFSRVYVCGPRWMLVYWLHDHNGGFFPSFLSAQMMIILMLFDVDIGFPVNVLV